MATHAQTHLLIKIYLAYKFLMDKNYKVLATIKIFTTRMGFRSNEFVPTND